MVDNAHAFELVDGVTIAEPGGPAPPTAVEIPTMSITAPHAGVYTGWNDDFYDPMGPRSYFKFTPATSGMLYLSAWASHWVDANGQYVPPMVNPGHGATIPVGHVLVGPRRPADEWSGPDFGNSYWDYDFRNPADEHLINVDAGVTYWAMLLTASRWAVPEGAAEAHLVLAVADVQNYTPWRDAYALPTILRDGEPVPRPDDRFPVDDGGDEDDDYASDFRARSHAHFVGRT